MAVFTQVSDVALKAFLKAYDVGTVVSFKGIAEGAENTNYLLRTTKSTYILTLYEKRTRLSDLPYYLSIMEHLAGSGLPCPLPIKDKDGIALKQLSGRSACLISFLEGVSVAGINAEHCGAVGDMLAQMHLSMANFPAKLANAQSIQTWADLTEQITDQADALEAGLSDLIKDELVYLEANWPKNLPMGTIHADLFPDNVLFTGDKITGVIDFYFACTDFMAYDLAVCINAWAFDENHIFQPARAKRMFERYDILRQFTGDELSALPILCRGAALRFLLTRLYDWQNQIEGAMVEVKDPLDYAKRLKFHQTVRDAADYVF